jgi:hypothetical protein
MFIKIIKFKFKRFFSFCGIICDIRSGAMKDDLIKDRCFLRANFEIIQELYELVASSA